MNSFTNSRDVNVNAHILTLEEAPVALVHFCFYLVLLYFIIQFCMYIYLMFLPYFRMNYVFSIPFLTVTILKKYIEVNISWNVA